MAFSKMRRVTPGTPNSPAAPRLRRFTGTSTPVYAPQRLTSARATKPSAAESKKPFIGFASPLFVQMVH